jgi:hypothetical protein
MEVDSMNPETLSPELVEIINRGIVNAVLLAMRADESGKDETQKKRKQPVVRLQGGICLR